MILHLIQCEGCKKTHPFEPMMGMPADQLPESWITLFQGPLRQAAGSNYCSRECLKKHLGVGESTQPLEQPATKMRRFRLFTEDGDEKQGVVCENGHVLIDDHEQQKETHYHSWDECKGAYDGGGAQWIDQEVNE